MTRKRFKVRNILRIYAAATGTADKGCDMWSHADFFSPAHACLLIFIAKEKRTLKTCFFINSKWLQKWLFKANKQNLNLFWQEDWRGLGNPKSSRFSLELIWIWIVLVDLREWDIEFHVVLLFLEGTIYWFCCFTFAGIGNYKVWPLDIEPSKMLLTNQSDHW